MSLFAFSMVFLSAALGQDEVTEPAPVAEDSAAAPSELAIAEEEAEELAFQGALSPAFLIVLGGGDQFVGKTLLTLEMTNGETMVRSELIDSGSSGDPVAGDGVFGGTGSLPAGIVSLRLLDGEVEVATGQVELKAGLPSPSLRLTVTEDILAAVYQSDGPNADEALPSPSGTVGIGAGVAPAAPGAVSSPTSASRSPWLGRGILVGGILLGFFIARKLGGGRRGALPLTRVGAPGPVVLPRSLMPARKGQRVWTVPDEESQARISAALAARLAEGGPVLLLARQESREVYKGSLGAGPAVHWLESGRAELDDVLLAVSELALWGEVAVVVEGLDALEEPDADEKPDAVFRDLLEELKTPLVMVTTAESPVEGLSGPVFERAVGGFRVGQETVVFERGSGRLEWAPGGNPTG